jgi:hypothetical protein
MRQIVGIDVLEEPDKSREDVDDSNPPKRLWLPLQGNP